MVIRFMAVLTLASVVHAAEPPATAIPLFNGRLEDRWERADGGQVGWEVNDDVLRVVPGAGSIQTQQAFGDFYLHLEFRLPEMPPDVTGQARANSGVYLQRRYEVQILDSHGLEPQKDTCGAIYGKKAADVDASRPAGEWQAYDIDFTAPRYDEAGTKTAPAKVTVRLNGVLIQNEVEIDSNTGAGETEGPGNGPILLQDHGNPIEFRNIWALDKSEGWESLFNGTSIGQWVKRGGDAEYTVENGAIVGETRPNTDNTFLCTRRTYSDFLLSLEFLVDDELNSGVQIRSLSSNAYQDGRVHGYQVEIDPSERAWTAGIYDEAGRGWLANLENNEAARQAFRHGEWNQLLIEARRDQFRTWLNGVPAADLHDDAVANGFIALQVHSVGDRQDPLQVRWRNIDLRMLNADD